MTNMKKNPEIEKLLVLVNLGTTLCKLRYYKSRECPRL